mmetsp:Transcript_59089/g.175676  ORF Transcript_59089/g.175676 Transcript_59089/m.175676 type:complete len:321 (-) Transcript_59089:321-1283(-)
MRVLITGSSGYLGQTLLRSLCRKASGDGKFDIVATYGNLETFESDFASSHLTDENSGVKVRLVSGVDLSDRSEARSLVSEHGPFDAIINLAAVSSPASCQKSPEYAKALNIPMAFLEAVSDIPIMIQLSTDQVYDGRSAPYREEDTTEPVNVYGETKLGFERDILSKRTGNVVLRSSLILGPETPFRCRKQTFLQFVRERLERNVETNFYTDEYRSAVYVGDVVRVIQYFLNNGIGEGESGVYNMGGSTRVSRMDIAQAVARHCNLDVSCAKGIARASLQPGNVPSPLDITMDMSKLERVTGIKMKGLDEFAKDCLPEMT